jgi:hypothetical protein
MHFEVFYSGRKMEERANKKNEAILFGRPRVCLELILSLIKIDPKNIFHFFIVVVEAKEGRKKKGSNN